MKIGSHVLRNNLVLAPMAGVTDKPFRQLCKESGAGLLVSEMITSNPALFNTRKTRRRLDHSGEAAPVVVQIAGAEPRKLAAAARFNVDHGADIIDINMGCPAKKVCNVMAGSALMQDETLVAKILESVVNMESLYAFYGEYLGLRIARKHIGWYCRNKANSSLFLSLVNQAQSCSEQQHIVGDYFQAGAKTDLAA